MRICYFYTTCFSSSVTLAYNNVHKFHFQTQKIVIKDFSPHGQTQNLPPAKPTTLMFPLTSKIAPLMLLKRSVQDQRRLLESMWAVWVPKDGYWYMRGQSCWFRESLLLYLWFISPLIQNNEYLLEFFISTTIIMYFGWILYTIIMKILIKIIAIFFISLSLGPPKILKYHLKLYDDNIS